MHCFILLGNQVWVLMAAIGKSLKKLCFGTHSKGTAIQTPGVRWCPKFESNKAP